MRYIMALLVLTVSGCATTAKLEKRMQARVGQDINDVINEIGPPSNVFVMPNKSTIYTWANDMGATTSVYNANNPYFSPQAVTSNNYCNISYTTDESHKVTSWRHEGNSCRSK